MTKLVRLILSLGLLLIGLSGCDNNGSPEPDGETMSNEQPDWPTATPPEGWVIENHYVDPDSTDYEPTAISIYREGQEVGSGPYNENGPASITVDVTETTIAPETILNNRFKDLDNAKRLPDRIVDGATFVGYNNATVAPDGSTDHFNIWWGQIPDVAFTIEILETAGTEDASVLEELYAISDTIVWPEDPSWAAEKWRSL